MVDSVKKRRFVKKDWDSVGQYVVNQLKTREGCEYRQRHERIWKEVDRQVSLQPMDKRDRDSGSWQAALELGDLSRASEILSADIRRMTFPQSRAWFEAHCDVEGQLNPETGEMVRDRAMQKRCDGMVRAMMTQQHLDFGLKARVDLSVKEALHHGSYVVEVRSESAIAAPEGAKIGSVSAPVWVPHSMHDCYPDPSRSITGTDMFYPGSMIIKTYWKRSNLVRIKGDGWMNLDKIEKKKEDVVLLKYFGDVTIERQEGDIYLPNSEVITTEKGQVVYYMPNKLPFSRIIYNGYERLDVRDPYYVSPLIKMAPMHKIASIMGNKFMAAIDLMVEPPIEFDGNDPDYILNGGPDLTPGAKNPKRGPSSFAALKVGDPQAALAGLQFAVEQVQKGTSVDNIRSGVSAGTEQTATEVMKTSQGGEIRTVDFVDKLELHGLRPFLYLQHELNKIGLSYSFYNQELDSPDFERMTQTDLPQNIHFEIIGSKGLLGEERRSAQTSQVTAFWMQVNPQMLNQVELAKEMYRDAGNKNPERFLAVSDEYAAIMQQVEAFQQQAQQQIAELEQEIASYQMQDQEHSLELQGKELEKKQLQLRIEALNSLLRIR